MKKAEKILLSLVACVVLLVFTCGLVLTLRSDDWKKRTTPLSPATVETLCTNFGLTKDHSLCNGRKEGYGPDYYDLIRDTFRPYEEYHIASSEAATYDEVKRKIGMFEYDCESVATTGDGFSFFICDDDLRGDREFIIGIMYTYPDNAVFRIMTPMGYDGE
jgi:hypothetical protein